MVYTLVGQGKKPQHIAHISLSDW